jgi:hypothetical protein
MAASILEMGEESILDSLCKIIFYLFLIYQMIRMHQIEAYHFIRLY